MSKRVIQLHHIIYSHPNHSTQKDVIVKIYKGEHSLLSRLDWYTRKSVSAGFIKALKVWLALNEDRAREL